MHAVMILITFLEASNPQNVSLCLFFLLKFNNVVALMLHTLALACFLSALTILNLKSV